MSELFASWEAAPHLNLTLGKKRVVWGSGMAVNPTDLLNPPKDPTDPAGQRAGAWLARAELPFEHFSVSLVGAAKVLRQYAGLPTALLVYPDYPTSEAVRNPALDDRDKEAHWAAAARLYALVADTDVTLTYHFTHLYNDAFREKSRVGLSLSRVFDATEVHLEALVQTGSSRAVRGPGLHGEHRGPPGVHAVRHRPPVPHAPGRPRPCAPRCWSGPATSSRTTPRCPPSTTSTARATAAASSPTTWGCWARDGGCWRSSRPSRPRHSPPASAPTGAASDPGSPQKFTFEPLRRHYLFLQYSKPQVADDFVLGASAVVNLGDLSGQLIPQVSWSAREWLSLSASVFIPLPGVKSLATEVAGERITEGSLSSSDWRALLNARLFF